MENQNNINQNMEKQDTKDKEKMVNQSENQVEENIDMPANETLTEIKVHQEKKKFTIDEDSLLYDMLQLIKENKAISGCVAAFILMLIIGVTVMTRTNKEEEYGQVVADAVVQEVEVEEVVSEPGVDELVLDMYPELNSLMKQYYQALADGDVDTINEIKEYTSDTDLIQIQKKSEYIEEYTSLAVYSKVGPKTNSYIVFVTYDVKFLDYESVAPGLNTWYVYLDENGQYKIIDKELDDDVVEFLNVISAQTEVIDLFNEVQVKYNEAKTADTDLGTFLDNLPNLLAASVGEALAALEEPVEVEEIEEVEEEPTVVVTKVRATDVVNIRSSDSQESDRIGQAQIGEEFELIELKANGWAHIVFEDGEGYILAEYLEDSEVEEVESTATTEDEEEEETEEADASDVTDTITITDTINIRKSASTTADKLGVVYPGDELDILLEQADGWTKVSYNGQVGYVLSELLE
ncbi:MAG: SH3 domain-containing protein [Eubacteriales bacterium]